MIEKIRIMSETRKNWLAGIVFFLLWGAAVVWILYPEWSLHASQ